MSWTLLDAPDGALVRSYVCADRSEELATTPRATPLPDPPALFESEADAALYAELLRRRTGRTYQVIQMLLYGFPWRTDDQGADELVCEPDDPCYLVSEVQP